jgi:hypothetical protein
VVRCLGLLSVSCCLAAAPDLASAQAIAIGHEPVGCVVAGAFPKLEARLDPAGSVARARVYFRGSGEHWYSVDMKADQGRFSAALPKPQTTLKQISYYVEALGRDFLSSRTANYTAEVVPGQEACAGKQVAAVAGVSAVTVLAPAGAPALPLGFAASGVTAGAAAAGGAVAATGGGHTGAIVIGALGAGAVAGGVVAAKKLGGDGTVVTRGFVYVGECTCAANRPPPYPFQTLGPLQDAVVSMTITSATATTDSQGSFELRAENPSGQQSGNQASATAAGCSTSTWNAGFDSDPPPIHITLTCSNRLPPARSCNCNF